MHTLLKLSGNWVNELSVTFHRPGHEAGGRPASLGILWDRWWTCSALLARHNNRP
ncbi:hypothetical protein JOQ06_005019, partial [Pogonophryne albipinna]